MFNSIEQIQRTYTTAIQPVQLFETRKNNTTGQNSYEFIKELEKSGHNPFYPDISNSTKGKHLDIMG